MIIRCIHNIISSNDFFPVSFPVRHSGRFGFGVTWKRRTTLVPQERCYPPPCFPRRDIQQLRNGNHQPTLSRRGKRNRLCLRHCNKCPFAFCVDGHGWRNVSQIWIELSIFSHSHLISSFSVHRVSFGSNNFFIWNNYN